MVLHGTLKDVKEQFRSHVYAIRFKGLMFNFANALFAGYSLEDKEQVDEDTAVAYVKLLKDNTLNDLLKAVIPAVQIESVNEVIPTMHDIFIQAVHEKFGVPVTEVGEGGDGHE